MFELHLELTQYKPEYRPMFVLILRDVKGIFLLNSYFFLSVLSIFTIDCIMTYHSDY